MVQKSDSQRTFMDTDYICERLVPQDSFYRKFKELVTPLIKDEDFRCNVLQRQRQRRSVSS